MRIFRVNGTLIYRMGHLVLSIPADPAIIVNSRYSRRGMLVNVEFPSPMSEG